MQTSSDSLGAHLREEREQQNVSLQDISATTKIQIKFLQALENDEYDQLPPSPFVVGFLRAYAQFLSLDTEAIVTTYQQRYRASEPLHNPTVSLPSSGPSCQTLGICGVQRCSDRRRAFSCYWSYANSAQLVSTILRHPRVQRRRHKSLKRRALLSPPYQRHQPFRPRKSCRPPRQFSLPRYHRNPSQLPPPSFRSHKRSALALRPPNL